MESASLLAVAAAGVAFVVALLALALSLAGRRRADRERDAAHREVEQLRTRCEQLSARVSGAESAVAAGPGDRGDHRGYVITSLTDAPGAPAEPGSAADPRPVPAFAAPLTAGVFASQAAGESLVRVVSLGYGVRRALSPENRDRIRSAMRREVRRSRKERRVDLKEAKRHLRAQRSDPDRNAA